MISKDLVFDSNDDLSIVDGDWEIGQSDDQNIQAILQAEKGQFYQYPLLGYGVSGRLYGPFRKNDERKAIREALQRDNYNVVSLIINDGPEIFVDAVKTK
jgi:hypothetical protein